MPVMSAETNESLLRVVMIGWRVLLIRWGLVLFFSTVGTSGALFAQEPSKEPLGSLISAGQVYVNESPAPVESTVFSGDTLRTGEKGTATFTASGKGTLKIAPDTRVEFAGSYLFTAELKEGSVVLNSAGANGIVLRAGNYVLIPSSREQTATSKIESNSDSSFLISCLDGSVGVLTMEGKSGELLHAGESMHISLRTQLSPILGTPRRTGQILRPTWVALGAGGVAAIAYLISTQSGSKPSVSPSAP